MALFEGNFPYNNYHELNLDWIIQKVKEYSNAFDTLEVDVDEFKKWVQNYLDDLAVPEAVEDILDQWAEDGTLQALLLTYKNTALTSNDIDMQTVWNAIFLDGQSTGESEYSVIQSMCITPGGNIITIASDEARSTQGMIREYSLNGALSRSGLAQVGHANGCTFANNKIYVAWLNDNSNPGVPSYDITIIDYNDFDIVEVKTMPFRTSSIAYDSDKQHILCKDADDLNRLHIMSVDLENEIDSIYLDIINEYPTGYRSNHASQDGFYYEGMYAQSFSFPSILEFYSLEDGHKVKMYSLPQLLPDTGAPISELESMAYYNGEFYGILFSRLDNIHSINYLVKMNPWKNVLNTYSRDNRSTGNKAIYVDGNASTPYQNGSEMYPFKTLMQAVNSLKVIDADGPAIIYCEDGTEVGALIGHRLDGIRIRAKSSGGDNTFGANFIINGCYLTRSSNILITNATFKFDDRVSATGASPCYLDLCDGLMQYCEFSNEGIPDNAYGIRLDRSRMDIQNSVIDSGFYSGIQARFHSVTRISGLNNQATYSIRNFTGSRTESAVRLIPTTQYWEQKEYTTTPGAVINNTLIGDIGTFPLVGDTGLQIYTRGGNYLAIEVISNSQSTWRYVPLITNEQVVPFNCELNYVHSTTGIPWIARIVGSVDLSNKTLTITDQINVNLALNRAKDVYKKSAGDTGTAYLFVNRIILV